MPPKRAFNRQGRAKSTVAQKIRRVKELILPTAPNQYGTTALAESDLERTWKYFKGFGTVGNQVYQIRQLYSLPVAYQSASSDTLGALNFTVSSLANIASLSAVFDQYRIRAVDVKFQPQFNSLNPVAGSYWPRLYTVIDYDDSNTTNINQLHQYDTLIVSPPGTGIVRCVQPRAALAAYSGSFTSYANVTEEWFDIASPGVQHYGIKYGIEQAGSSQTMLQGFTIDVTLYIQLRNAR